MTSPELNSPRWSIITVTFNSAHHIRELWLDLENRGDFRWIVVDNGSSDETLELLSEAADTVIVSKSNVGFSSANNAGLEVVTSEYVAFVNPDVRLRAADLKQLEEWCDRTGGLVGPQLINSDGSEQSNARGIPTLFSKVVNRLAPRSRYGREYARSEFSDGTFCAWLMGAAVACRTEVFRSLGGWDPAYFLYYEDHELGLRAWRAGLSVVVDPSSRWLHRWERATKRPSLRAWRYELESMRTFYASYPSLLLPSRRMALKWLRRQDPALRRLEESLWTAADVSVA